MDPLSAPCEEKGRTFPKHVWWHAPLVFRHLVCLNCGLGFHPSTSDEVAAVDHSTTGPSLSGGGKMVYCSHPREH